MKPHIFHILDAGRRWWVIGNGVTTVRGRPGETMMAVIGRWGKLVGQPSEGYVRVTGYCRPSEAAMQLGAMALAVRGGAT